MTKSPSPRTPKCWLPQNLARSLSTTRNSTQPLPHSSRNKWLPVGARSSLVQYLVPPAAAAKAELLVAVAGDKTAQATVKAYIVPAIAKWTLDCGQTSEKAALLKVLGNSCILGTIELLSESFTLAEKSGLDRKLFYEFIEKWFPAPAWINYGKKIRDDSFDGSSGFAIAGGMKDAGYVRRLGAESSTPTPIADQAWNHLMTAKAIGGDRLDWSACAGGMRVTAGLPSGLEKWAQVQPNGGDANRTQ